MSGRGRNGPALYNAAGRVWLLAAGLVLVLPPADRLGWWLPLHLALAGTASVTISGNLQAFAAGLSAGPSPPRSLMWGQFGAVNAGAAMIAAGYPTAHPGLVAFGGATFLASMALLGITAFGSWRRGLNRRHRLPVLLYGGALAAIVAGGSLGAVIGSGVVHDPGAWLALRRAHMTVNVLGFVSLGIVGTLITFLPTVLRVRMPAWHGGVTAALAAGGVGFLAAGFAMRWNEVAAAGAITFALGALGVAWMVVRTLRAPRRWPVPAAAKHLVPALAWFLCGSLALAVAVLRGPVAFDAFVPLFLVVFVLGWIVQTLLGAWLYLVPMAHPGGPSDRRRYLVAVDLGGTWQAIALNGGLALVALRAATLVPRPIGWVGVTAAFVGGSAAWAKSWSFGWMSRSRWVRRRAAQLWGA